MDSRDFVVKNMTNKIIKMLEVSKGNIENIINSLPNIVAIVKYNGTIFSGNQKLAELMGIGREDLIKTNINSLFKTPEWLFFQKNLNLIEKGEVHNKEFSLPLNKESEIFKIPTTFLWDIFPYEKVLRSGEKLFLVIGKDITEITHHQKELKKINANLEKMVEERTAKLREKTQDIANMLQNMKQGIFTILPNKTIHKEYSHYLEEIFKDHNIVGKNALNFLFRDSNLGSDQMNQMESSLSNILEQNIMTFQINEDIFVKEFQRSIDNQKRYMELDWNPIVDENEDVVKVLVNVKDVTEFKQLQLDIGAKKRELEIIGEILHITTKKFLSFTKNALKYLDENKKIIEENESLNPTVIPKLFRNMHTIKGNARTYELKNLTDVIHKVENRYDELRKSKTDWDQEILLFDIEEAREAINEYQSLCQEKLLDVQETETPPEINHFKKLYKAYFHQLKLKNKEKNFYKEAEKLFHHYNSEKFSDIIKDISKGLKGMAKDLKKPSPKIILNTSHLRIFKSFVPALKDALVHCFRNSFDHGFEDIEERVNLGKPPQGCIYIDVKYDKAFAYIQFHDDGRGLDLPKIREHGIQKNLIIENNVYSDEDLAQLIFHSGLSTAKKVSTISGRGIGMDAIFGLLTKKGGSIKLNFVSKKSKKGTRPFEIVIKIPILS